MHFQRSTALVPGCPLATHALSSSLQEPYAHFSWNFRDTIGTQPTWTCTIGHVSYSYDYYTGEEGYYVQQQNSNYFYKNTDTNK